MAADQGKMDIDLSLDEIIQRKRVTTGNDKKPQRGKPRKFINQTAFKPQKPNPSSSVSLSTTALSLVNDQGVASAGHLLQKQRRFDARNKIIEKTRAKIFDAREVLNMNLRNSGIDARQLLMQRMEERSPVDHRSGPSGQHTQILTTNLQTQMPRIDRNRDNGGGGGGGRDRGGIHQGRFGQRVITFSDRPGATVQPLWDHKVSERGGEIALPTSNHLHPNRRPYAPSAPAPHIRKPLYVPTGYIDHDNMDKLEEEEYQNAAGYSAYSYPDMGPLVGHKSKSDDPFGHYDTERNRIERPVLPPPPIIGRLKNGSGGGGGDQSMFDPRLQSRTLFANSTLSDSMRSRLFGSEPDRRISHGIYANENGSNLTFGERGCDRDRERHSSPPPPPPSMRMINNKSGYRLLVSNLHSNVTTADIRELFSDIGPMHDARVVRPGTAEVIYKTLEHAEKAVDTYHQREFDGQPMHCVLVNPHSSNRTAMSANSRMVTTNSSGVEVDIDALHTVLFRDR